MKKKNRILIYLFLVGVFVIILSNSCKKDDNIQTPVITTYDVSIITQTTATSGGEITSDGRSKITARGVCWRTGATPTIADNKTTDGVGAGSFTSTLSGLSPNYKYYLRAYATNSAGTGYGTARLFTTQFAQVPVVTTTAVSNITQTGATCGGEITSDGGLAVTVRGVCYSTSPNPTFSSNFTNNGSDIGLYSSNLTELAVGTKYYIRAFATNSVGTTYGNELNFTTIVLPTLTTSTFFDVKGNSARAGGIVTNNGGDTILTQGLCWSTHPDPTTSNSFNTSFTSVMSGLSPNTVYYARAYTTNFAGTAYGNQISFNSGYLIGSSLGGGLVFYNDGSTHGLVCADTDQSKGTIWGCNETVIGAFSTGINTGSANTNKIVAGCSTAGIAAKICYDLILKKYTDWYLPSKDELNLMYVNLHTQNLGGFTSFYYWSSSEYGDIDAWLKYFLNGEDYFSSKNQVFYVRAVRAF